MPSGAHAHFLERSYISPSPLSCRRYIVSVVKNGDRKGGAFTRIQIDPFCAAPTARVSLATAEKPARTAYKGVVAFCGNNQQVVAKQGYECISSAVNTVARRVRRHSFCFGPSLKGRRFCARVRPCAKYGELAGGREPERRRTWVLRRYIRSMSSHGKVSYSYCLSESLPSTMLCICCSSKGSLSLCEKTFRVSRWPIDFLPPSWIFFNGASLPLPVDNVALLCYACIIYI